jgi:GTP-binding protein EngB required for normal cell division
VDEEHRVRSSIELQEDGARDASRARVLEAIEGLLDLPAGLVADAVRDDLQDARERVLHRRFNVAVVGEFNRGKSTLVNALLGADVVPTGVLPLTSVVTLVRHGDPGRLRVRFADGREQEHPVAELRRFATEAANPGNRLGVELTVVETPNALLEDGLQIVDTPGFGSVHEHNSRASQSFLPRIDAAVVVLSADQPLSAAERELLETVDTLAGTALVVANRIDHLRGDDRRRVIEFLRHTLAAAVESPPPVLAASATAGTGLEEVRRAVRGLARADGDPVSPPARSRAVLRAAAGARSAAVLEARALDLPRAEIARRAATFRAQVDALAPAHEAAAAALERSVAEALRERVAAPLRTLAADRSATLLAELDAHAAARAGLSARALRRDLEAWVDGRVRGCMEEAAGRLEADVSAELGRLAGRYAAHVDEILARLADGVADALGERPSWSVSAIALGERRPFHYKLRDEGEGLGDAVSLVRSLVPGGLGRGLVRREARTRLAGLLDRHAGRLREQLTERTAAAIRSYQDELDAALDTAAAGVSAALERGRRELERGAAGVESRRAELAAAVARCDRIAATLGEAAGRGSEGR